MIVAPEGWEEPSILLAEELGCGKVTASVPGGPSRAESVRIGLSEAPDDVDVLLVHDAARPLIPEGVIDRLLRALGEGWDGAVPGLPLADTVKRISGDAVVETLPRDELVAVQTPQAFDQAVLRSAFAGEVAAASDCASLVEAAGGRVTVVPGDRRLLKITSPDDLALVESMISAR